MTNALRAKPERFEEDTNELLLTAEHYLQEWLDSHRQETWPLLLGALQRIRQAQANINGLGILEARAKLEAEKAMENQHEK